MAVKKTNGYSKTYDELVLHPKASGPGGNSLVSTHVEDRSQHVVQQTPDQLWRQQQAKRRQELITNYGRNEFLRKQHGLLSHLKTNGSIHTWGRQIGQSGEFPSPQEFYVRAPVNSLYGAAKGGTPQTQGPTYRVHELDMVDGYRRILA